jgi:RHS repeat-associated protein
LLRKEGVMAKRAIIWGIPAVAFVVATSAMILTGPSWASMAARSLAGPSTGSVGCELCLVRDSGKDGKKNTQTAGSNTQAAQLQGKNPVNVLTGEHVYSSVDFEVNGQNEMRTSRHYVTDPAYMDGDYGPGWRHGIPQLVQKGSNIVLVSASRGNVSWLNNGNGTYTPNYYFKDTLSSVSDHSLRYKDEDGNGIAFYDFSANWDPRLQGRVAYTSNAFLTNVYTGTEDSFLYYNGTATTPFRLAQRDQVPVNAGTGDFSNENKISRALSTNFGQIQVSTNIWNQFIAGTGTVWREVFYSYYDGSTGNGPAGALQFVHITDQHGNPVETKYYRYGALNGAGQLPLLYAVEGAAYERLLQASPGKTDTSVDQQTNAFIAPYANSYLYDSNLRVTSETIQGMGTTTFDAPVLSGFANDVNTWNTKAVEHLPDGNTITRFVSYNAQPLLTDVQNGSQHLITYYQYDSSGHLISEATPSAVASYTTTNPPATLGVILNASAGLIKLTAYAATTTATSTTPGDVQGYVQNRSVKQGSSGTAVLQESFTYIAHTATEQVAATTYPLAARTIYRNTNGTGGQTTTYSYSWQIPPGDTNQSNQVGSLTTTYPTVTTAQNGSGAATSTIQFFDQFRRPTWFKDENGFIFYKQWADVTGGLLVGISDVDTTKTGDFVNLPTGWTTPAGGGLHLKTVYANIDGFGRATKITDPNTNIEYRTYNDSTWEWRRYPGFVGSSTTGPTIVRRQDRAGSYREALSMTAAPHLTGGIPDGTEAISGVVSDTREYLDTGDRITNRDSYNNPPAWTASTTYGTLGTNFYRESLGYDSKGRLIHQVDWTGTIRDLTYDGCDRLTATKIGTNDTTSPNMIQDVGYEYDNNGVGNGDLTKIRKFTSASASLDTVYTYDFRDRNTQIHTPDGVNVVFTLDNLGHVTQKQTYGGSVTAANLRAQLQAAFDEKGQLYQRIAFQVDCETDSSPGTVRDGRTTNFWSNARGFRVKARGSNGEFEKWSYDGARRTTASFASFDDSEVNTDYASALTLTGDTVVEEVVYSYDANSNVIQTTSYRRCPSSSITGDLSVSWSAATSRRSFTAEWFDAANRSIGFADYGTNAGASFSRPSSPPAPPSGDTISYILSLYAYDSGGRPNSVTDNKSRVEKRVFDGLSRVTQTIRNFTGSGVPTETSLDTNATVSYVFDSSGRLSKQTALNPKGTGAGVQSQTTTYAYGTIANQSSPAVFRNDVLVAEIYPDSDDTYNPAGAAGAQLGNGTDGVYDRVEYTYDYASRKSTQKDQRGTVHTFTYDSSGRFSADSVTTLSSGVDGSVLRKGTTYDSVSRKQLVTSYSDAAGSTVFNQVKYSYGNLGLAIKREDSHVGAVVSGTTPSVLAGYTDGGPGTSGGVGKYVRPVSSTYPNGRVVYFNYPASGSTSVGDHLSRIDNIANDSAGTSQFGQYSYMGAGTILDVTHPLVASGLVYRQGPDSNPGGWDQFDRQIMTKWRNTANSFSHDLWNYTYDSVSNRLTRQNAASTPAATPKDEFYSYDGLRRLTNLNRGKLMGSPLTIANTAANYQQNWPALETLGNWRTFNVAASGGGTFTLQQTRSHNSANEIDTNNNDADAPGDSIGATVGTNWLDPTYDKAGNMTTVPSTVTGSETTGYFCTYDAWNRLVKVQNGTRAAPGSEVVEFQYDAEGWRTAKLFFVSTNVFNRTDYYFNLRWQCVEERTAANVTGKTTVATTPHYQWVWDLKYIDAVLLRDVVPIDATKRLYYCQDANQNTTALVNQSTGAVVERYLFEAYGKATILDGSWNSQAATANNNEIIFGGYRKDPETQLVLARNRVYHPTLGRWMQRDLIGYASGPNLFEYVNSGASNFVDPLGLDGGLYTNGGSFGPYPMSGAGTATAAAGSGAAGRAAGTAAEAAADAAFEEELVVTLADAASLIAIYTYLTFETAPYFVSRTGWVMPPSMYQAHAPWGYDDWIRHRPDTPTGGGGGGRPNTPTPGASGSDTSKSGSGSTGTGSSGGGTGGRPPVKTGGAEDDGKPPRTDPQNLCEKLTMDEAKGGAGKRIMQGKINDPRYPEDKFAKMEWTHYDCNGKKVATIHYWKNLETGELSGFKFKD